MSSKPSFPLPRRHFGDTKLAPLQVARFRAVARAQLDAVLVAERDNTRGGKRVVDTARWKLAKTKNELRIYKSRASALFRDRAYSSVSSSSSSSSSSTSKAYGSAQPSMLSVGRMQGSLEDLIYGMYSKSDDEFKTTSAFLDMGTKDCAVLHTLELATPDDPLHYLGIKWTLTQLPGALGVKPRDWCYLNAMGIETDNQGKRFGYIIMHSVDAVCCPPFDQRYVVRGQMSLSFVFRELSPGLVDIFSQGLYDPAGELIHQFSTLMTSQVLGGIFQSTKCAQTKKLTVLVMHNNDLRRVLRAPSSASSASSVSSSKSSSGAGNHRACSNCGSSRNPFSSLKTCYVCCATVCSKCRIKKSIFVGSMHSLENVTCCHTCAVKAKDMHVRPAEPQFSILTNEFISPDTVVAWSSSDDAASESADEPTPMHNMSFVVETNGDVVECDFDEEESVALSGMSETDVERMIEAMVGQRLHGSKAGSDATTATAASSYDSISSYHDLGSEIETVDLERDWRSTTALAAVHDGAYATYMPRDEIKTLPPDQKAIYLQMLRLQNAAHQVYTMTKANHELMMRSNTQ